MSVFNPAQIVVGRWKATYKSADIGYLATAAPSNQIKLEPVTSSDTGTQQIGLKVIGAIATIAIACLEPIKANIALAFPWWDGSGLIPLCPTEVGGDLYDFAGPLLLHPEWMGTDTNLDHTYPKAVATGKYELPCDGKNNVKLIIVFTALPDRSKFPDIDIGHIGHD